MSLEERAKACFRQAELSGRVFTVRGKIDYALNILRGMGIETDPHLSEPEKVVRLAALLALEDALRSP